jgi:hypothetical protein
VTAQHVHLHDTAVWIKLATIRVRYLDAVCKVPRIAHRCYVDTAAWIEVLKLIPDFFLCLPTFCLWENLYRKLLQASDKIARFAELAQSSLAFLPHNFISQRLCLRKEEEKNFVFGVGNCMKHPFRLLYLPCVVQPLRLLCDPLPIHGV